MNSKAKKKKKSTRKQITLVQFTLQGRLDRPCTGSPACQPRELLHWPKINKSKAGKAPGAVEAERGTGAASHRLELGTLQVLRPVGAEERQVQPFSLGLDKLRARQSASTTAKILVILTIFS
ncbi:hypothetical protein ACJZ2D_004673 [Fusarium nematophilum]